MTKRKNEPTADRARALVVDYKRTFGSEHGKRVLHDLMLQNYMYQTTFAHTPHEMAIREGARSVVMQILNNMNTDPDKLRDLIREQLDERT